MSDTSTVQNKLDVLVIDIGGKLFGVETLGIKRIAEILPEDPSVIIEPYLGSYQFQGGKIPLINLANFFKLGSVTRLETIYVLVCSYSENNGETFALAASKVLGKLPVASTTPLPLEAMLYPDIYKCTFEFNGSHIILLDLQHIFERVVELVRSEGAL